MKKYDGRLWLVPFRDSKVRVQIELDEDKIRITSKKTIIGDWPLPDVIVRSIGRTEARLSVEGEELVVFSRDADLMPALAVHKREADRRVTATAVADAGHSRVSTIEGGEGASDSSHPVRSRMRASGA